MRIKSKLAKTAVAGGVVLGLLGIGAGVASADPGPDQRPVPQQQQGPGPDRQQPQGPDWQQPQGPDRHQDPTPQPAQHGFWFFGLWIPLP